MFGQAETTVAPPATPTVAPASPDELALVLPACYSKAYDDCVNCEGWPNCVAPTEYPSCPEINRIYDTHFDEIEARVQDVPFCDEKPSIGLTTYVLVGGAGVLAGFLLGKIL